VRTNIFRGGPIRSCKNCGAFRDHAQALCFSRRVHLWGIAGNTSVAALIPAIQLLPAPSTRKVSATVA
jgi:hypothetical protein